MLFGAVADMITDKHIGELRTPFGQGIISRRNIAFLAAIECRSVEFAKGGRYTTAGLDRKSSIWQTQSHQTTCRVPFLFDKPEQGDRRNAYGIALGRVYETTRLCLAEGIDWPFARREQCRNERCENAERIHDRHNPHDIGRDKPVRNRI